MQGWLFIHYEHFNQIDCMLKLILTVLPSTITIAETVITEITSNLRIIIFLSQSASPAVQLKVEGHVAVDFIICFYNSLLTSLC